MPYRKVFMLVVSAQGDFHNDPVMPIFSALSERDKKLQKRTIGVITKPDLASSHVEIFELIKGKLNFEKVKHGWHVIRNQSPHEREETLDERDQKEIAYFDSPRWRELPDHRKGIASLRLTLKAVLRSRIKGALPQLVSEVKNKITETKRHLDIVT